MAERFAAVLKKMAPNYYTHVSVWERADNTVNYATGSCLTFLPKKVNGAQFIVNHFKIP